MPPEFTEIPDRPLTNEEHILADLHELTQWAREFEETFEIKWAHLQGKIAEWEEIARPLARIRDAGKLSRLGRGRGRDAVPQDPGR